MQWTTKCVTIAHGYGATKLIPFSSPPKKQVISKHACTEKYIGRLHIDITKQPDRIFEHKLLKNNSFGMR